MRVVLLKRCGWGGCLVYVGIIKTRKSMLWQRILFFMALKWVVAVPIWMILPGRTKWNYELIRSWFQDSSLCKRKWKWKAERKCSSGTKTSFQTCNPSLRHIAGQRPFFPHCWIERLKSCCATYSSGCGAAWSEGLRLSIATLNKQPTGYRRWQAKKDPLTVVLLFKITFCPMLA